MWGGEEAKERLTWWFGSRGEIVSRPDTKGAVADEGLRPAAGMWLVQGVTSFRAGGFVWLCRGIFDMMWLDRMTLLYYVLRRP